MDNSISPDTPQGKQCRACEQFLPLAAFSKDRNKLRRICRTCASQQYKSYYQTHKEERSRQYAQWEQEHKEERREYYTQYNQSHREEHRAFAKQYYHEHKEERKEYHARYNHSEHGKQVKEAYNHSERGRALRSAINNKHRVGNHYRRNSFTANQFLEQLKRQKYRCYYCHERHTEKGFAWHAEHIIPLSRGGTNDISNVVAACPTCNCSKGNKMPHEWPDGGRLL